MRDRPSRREFLGLTAAGGAAVLLRPPLGRAASVMRVTPDLAPDLVVVNAKVYTVDPAAPRSRTCAPAATCATA